MFGMPVFELLVFLAVVVLVILAILMPVFVLQIRNTLRRIERRMDFLLPRPPASE